jgi:glycosyltransferase involved in cell wall biosynthesis
MRVHVVDPSAYTPPYDEALCRALARAGAEVELFTSRFAYGAVPPAEGYVRRECFYRLAHRGPAAGVRSRAGLALKAAEHVPDMLRYRRAARTADIVHFQWLTMQPLDSHLLPRRAQGGGDADRARGRGAQHAGAGAGAGPRLVLTAHDVLPREPRRGQLAAQRRLYERVDAVVVHSEHGRRRLVDELGLPGERVHVIAHGVLRPWEGLAREPSSGAARERGGAKQSAPASEDLPPDFRGVEGPVVLSFGLLRPYKGLDVLLEAWRETGAGGRRTGDGPGAATATPRLGAGSARGAHAELWVVGMPRMDVEPLRAAALVAERAGAGRVRFLTRFVSDAQAGALMRRASVVVAPYREIDQSGVAFTALGAGTPLLLSDAGGFPELAATGAARTVPAGDALALGAALAELLDDPESLAEMTARARAAAAGAYSWEAVARAHLELYERLLAR